MRCSLAFLLLYPGITLHGAGTGYIGSQSCGLCHKAIAATQAKTRMALSWQGTRTALLPTPYREISQEGSVPAIAYSASREDGAISYRVTLPGREPFTGDIEQVIGGDRHGLSFMMRVPSIAGVPLERAALIETRYLHSGPHGGLVLSPGFPTEKPESFETGLGRALSLDFEGKCLGCHGKLLTESTNEQPGVRCEHCHGPGLAHLIAVGKGTPQAGIQNPARLDNQQKLETCSQCHSGFSRISDPLPDDLMISNQVNALKNSECYIQSGKGLSCMNCHDPHTDSPNVEARSTAACLSCHSPNVKTHAALCPVNRTSGCTGCHMPELPKGSFQIVDHWIRVHPERSVPTAQKNLAFATQVRPVREFLKIIVMTDPALANNVRASLVQGESFFDVAAQHSIDPTGPGGGYLGEMWLDQMDPKLAAAAGQLQYGEISPVIATGGKQIILARLPRDFKWQADQLQQQANDLRARGKLAAAIERYRDALRLYPYFLRALIFLGTALGEQGNPERAVGVLQFAAKLYPEDPAAHYNLGIAYGAMRQDASEISAYQRALELEPDLGPAYQNLGAALFSTGRLDEAAGVYRRGLDRNPLSAVLYYNLSIVRRQQQKSGEADLALAAARAIDPGFVRKQEGGL